MANYYCLMSGLPDITIDSKSVGFTMSELKEEIADVLSNDDKKLMFYFFLKFDCINLVKLLKNPDAEITFFGNYTHEQFRDMITSAQELNFNVHRYPSFMSIFAREYPYKKNQDGFFPEDAMNEAYYTYAMKCPNKMIAEWYSLNFNISNILTALIARRNNWVVSDFILGDNEVNEMIRTNNTRDFNLSADLDYVPELIKIAECPDPVEKEKKIDAFKWLWLEDKTFFDVFSIEAVFAYFCKLEIIERWEKLDPVFGKQIFRQIIEDLRGDAKVPEEYVPHSYSK